MKKIITFLLAICLCVPFALAAVGCGKKETNKASSATSGFYDYQGNLKMSWSEIVKKYPTAFLNDGKTITNPEYGATSPLYELEGILVVDDSVTELDDSAFEDCRFREIQLPASVKKIGERAFAGCWNLEKLTILGNSFDRIGKNWLVDTNRLEYVFIGMTYEQFEGLDHDTSTYGYLSGKLGIIYFYSKQAPQTSGHFWHFDLDGKTPTAWPEAN